MLPRALQSRPRAAVVMVATQVFAEVLLLPVVYRMQQRTLARIKQLETGSIQHSKPARDGQDPAKKSS